MTGPTGLIFAMKSRYTNQSGAEAFGAAGTGADEADIIEKINELLA